MAVVGVAVWRTLPSLAARLATLLGGFAMRCSALMVFALLSSACLLRAGEGPAAPSVIARPEAFKTLVNPACSHCRDEAQRRAAELRPTDRILAWTRGYSEGGAIPFRFFLSTYRVISDSYGVFVYDPDAGFARGYSPSYEFRFYGWRNGVVVMQHKDGTLYSSLSGLAYDGPRKGSRLHPIPAVVSDWGWWLDKYPGAVAYHMFDQYQPLELPGREEPDSVRSRGQPDSRLAATEQVLGVWTGKLARAYPLRTLAEGGFIREDVDSSPLVILWEPKTRTAAAYRPVASQPRKYKGPQPDSTGVSKPDAGVPIPVGTPVVPVRKITLHLASKDAVGRFQDLETRSYWDVAGRCVEGELKGYTLEWVDSVQVKWFAWAAEYPASSLYTVPKKPAATKADPGKKVKAIAGTAEFLRLLPKPFATVKAVDPRAGTITLVSDGDKEAKTWRLETDAEVKVGGWWGRLEQFQPSDRVWFWLKLDRKKHPVSIVMLSDEATEFDMHGSLRQKPVAPTKFTAEEVERRRAAQKAWVRKQWVEDGLPGTLTFHHVFSGELELTLDHEAMRWGRSLNPGDTVHLRADPPIKGVVKAVLPWRERTVVRLVVGELEASELRIGQRLGLQMTPPAPAVDDSPYPPDIGRARSRVERIEWFLASTYCTCGVSKDVCTGHFYTLASCNPNGCAMPNARREAIAQMIDRGMTDQQIFDDLLKDAGPLLLKPHLMP
jgi:hypothetical protein